MNTMDASTRTVDREYRDPLDVIWLAAAVRLGWRVQRSAEVYAAWDGAGTLTLSTAEHFDADDSLAQLLFHEMCHALVEGPAAAALPDWGLCNQDERHVVNERACHRVQAALAAPYRLRTLLAPTTDHRPYYDALPEDPLAGSDDDGSIVLARAGLARAGEPPWAAVLGDALAATAAVARAVAPFAPHRSSWGPP